MIEHMRATLALRKAANRKSGTSRRRRVLCGVAGAVLLIGHAAVRADVPVNGRRQDLDFTGAEVRAVAAASYAARIERLRHQGKLVRDAHVLARLHRVMRHLIAEAVRLKPEAAGWGWELNVADSDHFDAFSMAGGKILLSARFLRREQLSDGEVAALLAHEIAHALAEHVREELTAVRRLDPAYADLGPEDIAGVLQWDLSVSLKLAELSRLHELEADDIGIFLAAKAGFDPQAMLRFYRKLSRRASGQYLIDTHGTADGRLRAVENFAAYAELVYREHVPPRTGGFVRQ